MTPIKFVLVGLLLTSLVSVGQAIDESGYDGALPPTRDAPGPISSLAGNLFDMVLHPIRLTVDTARRLFSAGTDRIDQGIDMARLQAYRMFTQLYNKTYSAAELPRRMALYFQRKAVIEESERQYRAGKALYVLRENKYTDWTDEELKRLNGLSPVDKAERDAQPSRNSSLTVARSQGLIVGADPLPLSKDWRTTGCVSKVFDQGSCSCSYAAAPVALVETMRCLKYGWLEEFSVQQIVDCSYEDGCYGGSPKSVLAHISVRKKVAYANCYPYKARKETCRSSELEKRTWCTAFAAPVGTQLEYQYIYGESDIKYHLARYGPVVATIEATNRFKSYGGGIFEDSSCGTGYYDANHAVLIVGYGSENDVDYWLMKNSWGEDWGEKGYAKFRRGATVCSVGRQSSLAITHLIK